MSEWTEGMLIAAILKTWPYTDLRPRYVTGIQVRNAAGYSAGRMIDAVVFDTWPSTGMKLHGLEIKVSKQDLRRELLDPSKSAKFTGLVDRYSIVAPQGVADLKLLPKAWGLYCPTEDGKLRARRKPLPLRPEQPSSPTIDRSFAAAFVRALIDRSIDRSAMRAEYERGKTDGQKMAQEKAERAARKLEDYQRSVRDFEDASGVRITNYNGKSIGEAVTFILNGGMRRLINRSATIKDIGTRLITLVEEMEALREDE
jgi:hypothetical protein